MKWLINAILQTGYRGQKTKVNGRSPLRWWRSALDCSAIEEEEEEKQEEEEEEEEKEDEEEEEEQEEEQEEDTIIYL